MILMKKTLEEIMQETTVELEGMGITDSDAGSVARLFLTIINKQLTTFYEALDVNIAQAFVSTATDSFLDKIGLLVDCERLSGEENENYRYRITKQLQTVASANQIAVRLAALSVSGVQEVKLKRWTHGSGSFSVYVVSDQAITPTDLIAEVQAKIDEVEAFGVRGEVFSPIPIKAELKIRLIFEKGVTDLDRQLAITKALEATKTYVNSRNVGDPFIINELKKEIDLVHDQISEIIVFMFKLNDKPVLVVDQECAWNERFIESDKANSIQVM